MTRIHSMELVIKYMQNFWKTWQQNNFHLKKFDYLDEISIRKFPKTSMVIFVNFFRGFGQGLHGFLPEILKKYQRNLKCLKNMVADLEALKNLLNKQNFWQRCFGWTIYWFPTISWTFGIIQSPFSSITSLDLGQEFHWCQSQYWIWKNLWKQRWFTR